MAENANSVWDDGPMGAPSNPDKARIRAWGTWLEAFVTAIGANSGSVFSTRAAMYADLAHAANSMAWVVQDPTVAYNGIYKKNGASGSGSWTRVGDLPYSFIQASDIGAGTPNAIQATTSIPVSGSALVLMNIYEANTSSPVTVSFNGGPVLTIKSNSGNNVVAGGLVGGMQVLGVASGSVFRIVSDQASAAIQALAEASAVLAQAWAQGTPPGSPTNKSAKDWSDIAQTASVFDPIVRSGTTSGVGPYDAGGPIGSVNNIDIKIDGVLQDHSTSVYTISGNNFTLVDNPGGVPWESIIRSNRRELLAPSAGSVQTPMIVDDAVTTAKVEPQIRTAVAAVTNELANNMYGSITPIVKGGTTPGTATYNTAQGTYRLVNGMVLFNIELDWTGGTGTGDLYVDGLPFVSADMNSPVSVQAQGITFTGSSLQAVQLAHRTDILLQNLVNGSTSILAYDAAGTMRLSGMYPASKTRRDMVWMGDSVTYAIRPGVVEQDSFRTKVQNGRHWAMGKNRGVPGENASEMRTRFVTDVVSRAPQVVHIMTGINDYFDGYPAASMKADLVWMVAQAQAAGITVTLSSATATQDAGMLAGFGPYLTAQQEVGASSGVVYVPVYEKFMDLKASMAAPDYAALFVDTQHIGPLGHDVVANLIVATPNAC